MTMTTGEEHLPKSGEVLAGKYRIERIVGKGGMGAVLAAHHELLGERVAIKFLLGEIAQNAEAVERFNREARNAFKIQSEHVCRIMDVGNERGMPFMVMEFLDGEDLSQILEKRGAFPVEEAVDYVLQGLEAIAAAHAAGMVHRDLKPANMFLHHRPDGSSIIKVLDFGIAKSNPFGETGGHNLTSTKSMLGSPLYMSPEQLRSAKNVDARADVWALGVILYELLTGTVPFNGETLGELFIAILEQPAVPVSHKRPDVPQLLSDAVGRCLMRNIDQRFGNVAELAQAIAPCAPARSFVSVERVTQSLGLPKPSGVMPIAGSMPDPRAPMPSYGGMQPNAFSSSQSGPQPQMASSYSGQHQLPPPQQGGTQLLGAQTNSAWGATGGGAQAAKSKAPLIVGLAVGLLALAGVGTAGAIYVSHKTSAAAQPTTSAEAPKPPETAAPPEPTTTAAAQPTATPTATQAASVATAAPSETAHATSTHTSHTSHTTHASAATHTHTATATAAPATAAGRSNTTAKPANSFDVNNVGWK
jgi:serine/threonine protein kinase